MFAPPGNAVNRGRDTAVESFTGLQREEDKTIICEIVDVQFSNRSSLTRN